MPDPLRSQQDGIIQIEIGLRSITQRFSTVKYKRNIYAFLLLLLSESQQGLCIINQRLQLIFISNKIESYLDNPNNVKKEQ